MDKLIFEGVRCFHGLFSCPIRPVTILLGENSSGKSTFLALYRIAWDLAQGEFTTDYFNEEPFLLGSFDQIASYRGGKAGRAKQFTVGFEAKVNPRLGHRSKDGGTTIGVTAKFRPQGSECVIDEWTFEAGKFSVSARPTPKLNRYDITLRVGEETNTVRNRRLFPGRPSSHRILSDLRFLMRDRDNLAQQGTLLESEFSPRLSVSDFELIRRLSFALGAEIGERPYAFAPIRTRPQRTYDPVKDVPRPEGSHVPMTMAKLVKSGERWRTLRQSLAEFGKISGLFDSVDIRRKGGKQSDPFQVTVRLSGPAFNLVDVGYGISQVLPILVDVLEAPSGSSFLLQQPEVHLHPKAQAALASFLVSLAKEQHKQFLIETHSDYLLDRIRMDIREGKGLSPSDVVVLYFHRSKGAVKIYPIEIDEYGNLQNAPRGYRQFFLDEEKRLFGL